MYKNVFVSAILLAAGSGLRYGGAINKVFDELCGRPVLEYSLRVLDAHPYVDELIIAYRNGEHGAAAMLPHTKPATYVCGGSCRNSSVMNALKSAGGKIILIHDGARPLICNSYVTRCIQAMDMADGAAMAVPSKDTIKTADIDGFVTATIPRDTTWIVQTPQVFRKDALQKACDIYPGDRKNATDECMILEKAGYRVRLVHGDYENIKITTPGDKILAQAFLSSRTHPGEDA